MTASENELDFAMEILREEDTPDVGLILKKVILYNSVNGRLRIDFTKIFWLVRGMCQ